MIDSGDTIDSNDDGGSVVIGGRAHLWDAHAAEQLVGRSLGRLSKVRVGDVVVRAMDLRGSSDWRVERC